MAVLGIIFLGIIGMFLGLVASAGIGVALFWSGGEEAMGYVLILVFAGTGIGGVIGVVAGVKMK